MPLIPCFLLSWRGEILYSLTLPYLLLLLVLFLIFKFSLLFSFLSFFFFFLLFGCTLQYGGSQFPNQGLNRYPLHQSAVFLNHWTTREVSTLSCFMSLPLLFLAISPFSNFTDLLISPVPDYTTSFQDTAFSQGVPPSLTGKVSHPLGDLVHMLHLP